MRDDDVAARLKQTVGVQPSLQWLQQASSITEPDLLLDQILHHDLRDVVRQQQQQMPTNDAQEAPVQLREALSATPHTQLPASFRLMLQVEELVDVSRNREARLLQSSTGTKQRCLKAALSDGYYGDGTPWQDNPSRRRQMIVVALELLPIPDWSADATPAGCKVLLHGPITIRHGCLLLHPGNCLVLGGFVPELLALQTQAKHKAQKVAGVDPTIRALVGDRFEDEQPEQDDEGDQESSDLPTRAPTSVPSHTVPPTAPSRAAAVPPRVDAPPPPMVPQRVVPQPSVQSNSLPPPVIPHRAPSVPPSTRPPAPSRAVARVDAPQVVSNRSPVLQSTARPTNPYSSSREEIAYSDLLELLRRPDRVHLSSWKVSLRMVKNLYFNIEKRKRRSKDQDKVRQSMVGL